MDKQIYFIKCGPYFRVGHSADPAARLERVQVWNPYAMELVYAAPGARDLERRVLDHLLAHRDRYPQRGAWFELRGLTAEHCQQIVKRADGGISRNRRRVAEATILADVEEGTPASLDRAARALESARGRVSGPHQERWLAGLQEAYDAALREDSATP